MITLRCGLVAAALLLAFGPAVRADELVERGRALVNGIVACGNCHTPQGPGGPLPGMELAGGTPFVEPVFTAYGANITPDPETGIGRWSDEQLIRAIRDGVRPDGTLIGPPMPVEFYKGISDSDVKAIIAYLRSVPPVRNLVPRSEYAMPMPASYGPPTGMVPDVPKDDPVRYGAYMAGPLGHCLECHTPMLSGGRRDMARAGAGGQVFRGPWGETVARNITSDPEKGLGRWSDAEIKRAVTEGIRPDGARLGPPMAFHFYNSIDPADLDRLVAFLRTLPPRS